LWADFEERSILTAKPSQWTPGNGAPRPEQVRPAADPAARTVEISVVIPVFNEESCIEPLWERLAPVLQGLGRAWEVVFVDDGSTDAGPGILLRLRRDYPAARMIRMARNQGQSAALDAGFRAARGGWIVTLDADLQNPPEEIPRLFEAAGGVELVFGRRRRRRDSWFKRTGSRIGNGVRNLITGHRVRDTGCSLKLYRADALRRIPLFRGMHRFLPTLFVFHGYRIREIEVEHHPRVSGTSKYGNLARAWHGLADCFAVRWMRRRSLDYRAEEIGTDENPS
jgi:glycosyltransferase involved in cell wall biosynthesis